MSRHRHYTPPGDGPGLFDEPAAPPKRPDRGFAAGMAGSALAGTKRSPADVARLMEAIRTVARQRPSFTSQHVWEAVPDLPQLKDNGMRLLAAQRAGWIHASGEFATPEAAGEIGPDHGQRLQVWWSLIYESA